MAIPKVSSTQAGIVGLEKKDRKRLRTRAKRRAKREIQPLIDLQKQVIADQQASADSQMAAYNYDLGQLEDQLNTVSSAGMRGRDKAIFQGERDSRLQDYKAWGPMMNAQIQQGANKQMKAAEMELAKLRAERKARVGEMFNSLLAKHEDRGYQNRQADLETQAGLRAADVAADAETRSLYQSAIDAAQAAGEEFDPNTFDWQALADTVAGMKGMDRRSAEAAVGRLQHQYMDGGTGNGHWRFDPDPDQKPVGGSWGTATGGYYGQGVPDAEGNRDLSQMDLWWRLRQAALNNRATRVAALRDDMG